MSYVFTENQERVTLEIRLKKVWPNNTTIHKLSPHVDSLGTLKFLDPRNSEKFKTQENCEEHVFKSN